MNDILDNIARENFRNSGYLTHPSRERRIGWTFSAPPRSPFSKTDTVREALQRRERACRREQCQPSIFRTLFHVFFRRS
ncbi:MAG: hypothetical protein ACNA77_05470 [Opitutales bacterium]